MDKRKLILALQNLKQEIEDVSDKLEDFTNILYDVQEEYENNKDDTFEIKNLEDDIEDDSGLLHEMWQNVEYLIRFTDDPRECLRYAIEEYEKMVDKFKKSIE